MQSRPAATLLTILAIGPMMVALAAASGIEAAQARQGEPLEDPPPSLSRYHVALLDGSMERVLQDFAIPGLAIGIVENGEPVYIRGFGVRDTRSGAAVNTHTRFHVGPITRTFTATAVLQLVERGQLDLTDSIADSPVTVAQLLTRNDEAFNALAGIIESASQQQFTQYLQTSVLDAAGLAESTFGVPLADTNAAWPYTGKVFVRRSTSYPWQEDSLPSSGLSASIADVTRWAALQVSRDPVLLTAASYDAMIELQREHEHDGSGLAFGWQLERRDNEWLPRQTAIGQGFAAFLTLYPKQQRAIVILSNGETTPGEQIRDVIESVLAGEGYERPKPSLLPRGDFLWALGGLLGASLLLIAVSGLYRRRRRTLR
ncbi:MAG: serine hydrolase domain-containing protein [Pseudomonadota bacterium]|nr:serine hydrolase domain-containing protein [Pseudomonadota bacterium]